MIAQPSGNDVPPPITDVVDVGPVRRVTVVQDVGGVWLTIHRMP